MLRGAGGVGLHTIESGPRSAQPILFVHGFAQSVYAWRKQFGSELARDFRLVAYDLRGHGESEKPEDPAAYHDSEAWAGDLAAIVESLELERPVVVAWSYAGLVVADYLRFFGEERLGAVDLVAAVTVKGGEKSRGFSGGEFAGLFPALFESDPAVAIPALERFAVLCSASPMSEAECAEYVRESSRTPPAVREAMQRRRLDNDDVLATLTLPVLITHGTGDAIVLPLSSEHNARAIPNARLSLYPGIGHTPFVEDPERFERELRELATLVRS